MMIDAECYRMTAADYKGDAGVMQCQWRECLAIASLIFRFRRFGITRVRQVSEYLCEHHGRIRCVSHDVPVPQRLGERTHSARMKDTPAGFRPVLVPSAQ